MNVDCTFNITATLNTANNDIFIEFIFRDSKNVFKSYLKYILFGKILKISSKIAHQCAECSNNMKVNYEQGHVTRFPFSCN